MKHRFVWVFVAGIGAVLSACVPQTATQSGAAAKGSEGAQNLPAVGFVVLQGQDTTLATTLAGRATASATAQVRPQVTGIVQKQLFAEGAWVKRGQPLYQLDDEALRIERERTAAAHARAQTTAAAAAATLERNVALADTAASPSVQTLQDLRTAAATARADEAAARAAHAQAELNLRHARIAAPIAGRIGLSSVTAGALVVANQSTVLAEIVQTDPMHIDFTQSTAQLLAWKKSAQTPQTAALPLEIVLEDGSTYAHAARLVFDGLTSASQTMGTVTLRAVVPNPEGVLLPGMFVQVRLPRQVQSAALRVPQRAVSREMGGAASVLVVVDKDQAQVLEKRPVVLGEAVGADWVVDSGLSTGDRVVIDGFQKARAGAKVRAVPAAAQAQPRAVDAAAARAALEAAQSAKK